MRRILLALAVLIVITAVAAPAVLLWSALFTSGGLQFVLRHLPQQLGPVRLTITGVSGTVSRGLTIERVEIEHEVVHITLTGIEGRVALRPLVLQTIRVAHGRVQNALIEVKRRTKPSIPGPTNFLPAWLIINVEDGQVGTAKLTVYTGFHLEADDVRTAALLRQHYIRFYSAEGKLEDAHVNALGTLRATDPLGMEVKAHLDWTPAGQPPWTVAGSARGDLDALNIVAHVTSPFRADLTGQALALTSHWHWAADAVVQSFDLHAWNVNTPLGSIAGHLSGAGDESGFSAHGPVNPTGLHAGEFEVQWNGNYANHVLSAQRMEARHVASGARVGASGTIGIVDHGPRLDLKGEWSDFRWPLAGRQVAVRSPAGSFAIAGLMPYQVRLSGRGRAAELPEMGIDAARSARMASPSIRRRSISSRVMRVSAAASRGRRGRAGPCGAVPPRSTRECCAPICAAVSALHSTPRRAASIPVAISRPPSATSPGDCADLQRAAAARSRMPARPGVSATYALDSARRISRSMAGSANASTCASPPACTT